MSGAVSRRSGKDGGGSDVVERGAIVRVGEGTATGYDGRVRVAVAFGNGAELAVAVAAAGQEVADSLGRRR